MNELKAELQRLYADSSKHSVYQNLPDFVSAELGYTAPIDEGWRGDRPRLAYLAEARTPASGETWLDFGANTGFFTLSLARDYPQTSFIAVEANPNHARFIQHVAQYFGMDNVEVIQRAVGLRELSTLPRSEFMLHLNVLHHAGHDFDADLVARRGDFPEYARRYLSTLLDITGAMLFQMGSNWGGDKNQPLVGMREDGKKLRMFTSCLRDGGWSPNAVGYPRNHEDGRIAYSNLDTAVLQRLIQASDEETDAYDWSQLDAFPGEFYRRPLFFCRQ